MLQRRLFILLLCFVELITSSVVHLTYALSILSSSMVADFLQFFTSIRRFRCAKVVPISNILPDCTKSDLMMLESELDGQEVSTAPVLVGQDDSPIVLVHGIFGFGKGKMGGLSYWAGAEKMDHRVLLPDLGPLTSIYDRARELFYYLKGGTVDYCVQHSSWHGHSQFGHKYSQGHYPEWDEDHPVHFVAHSTGVQVVRLLQQMLADKKFKGFENTSADWVLSVTSLSGVLNGSTRVYLDGIRPEDGRTLSGICLLQLLRVGVLMYEWFDIPFLKKYYSFGFDHYNLSWRKSGVLGLAKVLLNKAGPFASGDWICPDLSIQSSVELNRGIKTHPNTYYFSYATKMTQKLCGLTVPSSVIGIHPLLFVRALQMCQWRHPSDAPPCDGYKDEDWHDNDGALNTISMQCPRFPECHPNCLLGPEFKDGQALQTGIWERAGFRFDILYNSIFQRCRKQMKRMAFEKVKSVCVCAEQCICHLSRLDSTIR
eukprot:c12706_g1_i2 orf=407-1861(-)